MEDELLLIEDLKCCDEQAFRLLVDRYQNKIFTTCFGIINDNDDADDVTQEVFIEVYKSIKKFKGDSKLSTWLYRIAINKSLNLVRIKKRKALLQSIGLISAPDIADDEVNFDETYDLLEQKKRKRMVWNAINSLPEKQRAAFVLNKISELKYSEIALTLNITLSSVESLIFRAKLNLQKKLCGNFL